MPSTYEPIATQTLGSATSSVTFSSIPGTYTDLVLVSSGTTSADVDVFVTFNGDTGANYSRTFLLGDGSSAASGRSTGVSSYGGIYFLTSQSNNITQVMNYSNSTTYKTALSRNTAPAVVTTALVGLWRSTAAITSMTLTTGSGTLSTGSTFTLYGIKAA
jgi:hypothetical protein